ncbi:hypothetical protein IAR55_002187 [Kwoniella newhampshirensis]|uniref:Uncharacterized protein n=1 Tax=Kwoniella newhampshirensis TaxID=1651941 RepID=A0AAW0Z130_9TREE
MPQPPLDLHKYLATPLPALREQYPPGTGGTGPRASWDGSLKGVQEIEGFEEEVNKFWKTVPTDPIAPHPNYKYPKIAQALTQLPNPLRSPIDLQKCLSTLPLAAISSALTAMDTDESDVNVGPQGAQALDRAGYESDGGEEPEAPKVDDGKTKAWTFKFNKSPMGSGEFYLMQQGSDDVKLVVRTINSSAFASADWDEYTVNGRYRYDTRSKASWYWSRSWGAAKRLGCQYYVLTDWQRWTFGYFNKERTHGWTSHVMPFNAQDPSIAQALFFWCRSAIGAESAFVPTQKDVSGLPELFPANPARRISHSGGKPSAPQDKRKVKAANESDIEESDAEAVEG